MPSARRCRRAPTATPARLRRRSTRPSPGATAACSTPLTPSVAAESAPPVARHHCCCQCLPQRQPKSEPPPPGLARGPRILEPSVAAEAGLRRLHRQRGRGSECEAWYPGPAFCVCRRCSYFGPAGPRSMARVRRVPAF
jgi:hypothetical protein